MSVENLRKTFRSPVTAASGVEELNLKGICKLRNSKLQKSHFRFVADYPRNQMLHDAILKSRSK